jgi:hypothetical protein
MKKQGQESEACFSTRKWVGMSRTQDPRAETWTKSGKSLDSWFSMLIFVSEAIPFDQGNFCEFRENSPLVTSFSFFEIRAIVR